MKAKNHYAVELTKELRETIHAYERKLKMLSPLLDHLDENDIDVLRKVIYQFMGPLQVLERLKKKAQKIEEMTTPSSMLVIE